MRCRECGKKLPKGRRLYCSKECGDNARHRRWYLKHYGDESYRKSREKSKAYAKKWRQRMREESRCVRCGAPIPPGGPLVCDECREVINS